MERFLQLNDVNETTGYRLRGPKWSGDQEPEPVHDVIVNTLFLDLQ